MEIDLVMIYSSGLGLFLLLSLCLVERLFSGRLLSQSHQRFLYLFHSNSSSPSSFLPIRRSNCLAWLSLLHQLVLRPLRMILHGQHVGRNFASRIVQDLGNGLQIDRVVLREIRNGLASTTRPTRSSDSMDVGDGRRWEIIVDDQIDALEIDATADELCADQHPDLALAERLDDLVALLLAAIGVDEVDVDAVVD